MMDIDYIPFRNLPLESIHQTYTYGQLVCQDKTVKKLTRDELIRYIDQRLNVLPWIHLSLVFVQNTDRYMNSSCSHLSWETLVSYTHSTDAAVFYSKSKVDTHRPFPHIPVDWKRVLSNFYPSPITLDGVHFPTPEHAFQGMKILLASSGPVDQALQSLLLDPSPVYAKKCGGRAAYKRQGLLLDTIRWEELRETVQHRITTARLHSDPVFVRILRWSASRPLIHYERGTRARPPFWGAFQSKDTGEYIGRNVLGTMLMAARSLQFPNDTSETN
jgi:predicted NAD-dependent protein-ADP-ribosyltransferase YbiA (DUF1768 family)